MELDFGFGDVMDEDFSNFKERKIRAKSIFKIVEISKIVAYEFVRKYHYLGDAQFFSSQSFGLIHKTSDTLVGVASFSPPQGNVTLKGWFGLKNDDKSVYELSRLCLLPTLNGTNASSYLLGGSIKILKQQGVIRAIITLADSQRHVGSIYQVCNFKYYGLTDKKTDFYRAKDGAKNSRDGDGTKDVQGVWIPRSQKHRYCYLIDESLKVNYSECDRPTVDKLVVKECCGGTGLVHDKRYDVWYTCPICTGEIKRVENS